MTLDEIAELLEARPVGRVSDSQRKIRMICGADLMSEILACARKEALLLTGLTNQQVVHAADVAGIRAVCFVRGKQPQSEAINFADEQKMPLLTTDLSMYESCGRLYQEDIRNCHEYK